MFDMNKNTYLQRGAVNGAMVALILLSVALVGFAALSVWALINYNEQRSNVQAKVDVAVAEAEKIQAEKDEEKFAEREKEPNREFAGPSDFGRLSFSYPKTWSVYVAEDGNDGGNYQAFLHPIVVPTVDDNKRYALRVTINDEKYEEVIEDYRSAVEDGELKTSPTSSNGHKGTRLDGTFDNDIRGTAVVYKIRDKTAVIRTDADTFRPDFEKLIKTINFNQ